MKDFVVKLFAVAVLYSSLAGSGFATVGYNPPLLTEKAPSVKPAITKDIRIDQKLDSQVPLDVPFLDENGSTVTLSDYAGKKTDHSEPGVFWVSDALRTGPKWPYSKPQNAQIGSDGPRG